MLISKIEYRLYKKYPNSQRKHDPPSSVHSVQCLKDVSVHWASSTSMILKENVK